MLGRFIRIMLAIATAFVFTAQVEAATQHCARLAHAAEAAVQPAKPVKMETPSCHETGAAGDAAAHHPAPHKQPAQDRCECIAVLSECAPVMTAAGSSLIAPYAWDDPEPEAFASTEPAPALRPPQA